jgi:hypothetical protein
MVIPPPSSSSSRFRRVGWLVMPPFPLSWRHNALVCSEDQYLGGHFKVSNKSFGDQRKVNDPNL